MVWYLFLSLWLTFKSVNFFSRKDCGKRVKLFYETENELFVRMFFYHIILRSVESEAYSFGFFSF